MAADDAIDWWKDLAAASTNEDVMSNVTGVRLQEMLRETELHQLSFQDFRQMAKDVHAM